MDAAGNKLDGSTTEDDPSNEELLEYIETARGEEQQ